MKKIILITISLVFGIVSSYSQLTVNSDGTIRMTPTYNYSHIRVHVGDAVTNTFQDNIGFASAIRNDNCHTAIGIKGEAKSVNSNISVPIGVLGEASNGTTVSVGVFGTLLGSGNGAGVYGSTMATPYSGLSGHYAGYFWGDTRVFGDLTAFNVYTSSDIRLKENVSDFSTGETCNALTKLMDVNVIKYNIKESLFNAAEKESLGFNKDGAPQLHFGVSAQELQEIYPNLVKEGQDGYLAVNYVELVPVLIRSIQELKQELDEVKGGGESRMTRSASNRDSEFQPSTKNVLYQNTPNPFKEQTIIRFSLADDAKDAAICIFDMTGKMLKNLPISAGATSVSINGWELGEGMFLYTLIVNGKEADTKRMIITK